MVAVAELDVAQDDDATRSGDRLSGAAEELVVDVDDEEEAVDFLRRSYLEGKLPVAVKLVDEDDEEVDDSRFRLLPLATTTSAMHNI